MGASVGDDIRRNVKAHLRGMRDIVRLLGSDDDRHRLAAGALPPVPEEFDRAVGRAFRLVDGVMTAVEAVAEPLRSRAAERVRPQDGPAGEIERALTLVAGVQGDQPALHSAAIHAAAAAAPRRDATTGDVARAAGIFLALARAHPLASMPERQALRLYAAAALLLIAPPQATADPAEARDLAENALLLAGARLDVFEAAATQGSATPALVETLGRLSHHLGAS